MTFQKTNVFAILFYFLFTISCVGQASSKSIENKQAGSISSISEKIDTLLNTYVDYGKFNGAVLVTKGNEIVYKKGFGLANVEWDITNQTDTKFRLASITKQFTAMLIVQLVAENKLSLEEPISTYMPDYPKKNGDQITLHHLLTHTSGMPSYTSMPNYRDLMVQPFKPMEIVQLFADLELEFTPGETFQYSNSGYVLLGAIIEEVTGKSYEEVLQERIFTPLKMDNSGYDHNLEVLKNRATGYNRNGNNFSNSNYIDMSLPYAAGAIYSTVEDLYRWDQALYSEALLPEKYRELLFKEYTPAFGKHYGYGWEIGEMRIGNTGEMIPIIGHGGGINGFNTLITRMPTDQSLVVLLNNTGNAPLHQITMALTAILHDKTYDFPKRSVAHSIAAVMDKNGIQAALEHFKAIKDSSDYYLNENEINLAGYDLLWANRPEEAAAIFKLNIETYPNAFNVYDSYGEALLILGDTAEGVENYKRSIQLNPENENGLNVLKDLGISTDGLIQKIPVKHLKMLAGTYQVTNAPNSKAAEWTIEYEVVKGELIGMDRGYRYKLVPVGDDKFINPDDGASIVFDASNESAITMIIFEKYTFRKVK